MTQLNVDRRYSIEQMRGQFLNTGKTAGQDVSELQGQSFAEILEQRKLAEHPEVKFSKHACERLNSRNIDLSEAQKERLNHAVKAAEAKGIKESLVMMDNFIMNYIILYTTGRLLNKKIYKAIDNNGSCLITTQE